MIFHVVTIFPPMIQAYLEQGIVSRAAASGLIDVRVHDLRDYAVDRYGHIDGHIFGTGKGMLFRPEPLEKMAGRIREQNPECRFIHMTPRGRPFDNTMARRLASYGSIAIFASRYEGMDARAESLLMDEEISIGDYVLTGGELPALVVLDAVSRFVEGSIKKDSADAESFENGLLENDHYTEPLVFQGLMVPDSIRSGSHKAIEAERHLSSVRKTFLNRPDLLREYRVLTDPGDTKDELKRMKRINRSLQAHLEVVQKSLKEWKDVRRTRNQDR